ncbi:MAG: lipid IV(A) 3-deoxy-D-manno-octulosonic acid transferase [Alcanivoracaceae bacterium]|nr:lipid IV(A) 3-deoxy-D-manno-octulosonic acid transferase [Alcanivoracaceae bacterium]
MRIVYSILWYLLVPLLLLRLWWRGRRAPAYRLRWRERLALGYRPAILQQSIWVHVVSVGEALAAAPMIRALRDRYPALALVVTTTTPTGSERVRALFGDSVTHVYCPWELPGALRRFFLAFNPILVVVMETELWPNLVAQAARRGVPVVLANGRLSASSARGYARLPALVRPMLAAFRRLFVQTEEEAQRFVALGAPADRVEVTGSVKFDLVIDDALRNGAATLREQIGERPVWIAASTHPGEDQQVLVAHQALCRAQPDALLVLVPRHPERFDDVARLVEREGLTVARRSASQSPADGQVYLADTMGELLMLYGAADVAFVAGSWAPVGGHNLLEPAAWGKPVLSGPVLHNFSAIAELLQTAGGLTLVEDADALAQQLIRLFGNTETRHQQGQAAMAVVNAHRGALERLLQGLAALLPSASA